MRMLLVVYDNDSYIHSFPIGLGYIAAVLLREGYEVEIYNQDMNHWPESHLTRYLDENRFDAIGLSFIAGYSQYRKAIKISEAINRSKNRPVYILGGHGPTPEPEFFLRKMEADVICMGEGEETVVELMDALKNKKPLQNVRGIAFRDGDRCIVNERRPLIENIDAIPFPAYQLFPMNYYRLSRMPGCYNNDFIMMMLSGRGCTFECNFCYRMDKGFRPRSNESIIEEIKLLKKDYGITYIAFHDELLMTSVARTTSLCEDFIKHKLNIKWGCNGRLNYAKTDLLKLMKAAGCMFINYGIEAMDDRILKNMKKALTTRQIIKGIEATLEVGIIPGSNIIWGNIGENAETLKKGVEFLLKYHDENAEMRTIRPVTPYPGSPLYYLALEQGLIENCEDFYENKHLNSDLLAVNFTDLTNEEFHRCLLEANTVLIDNYFKHRREATLKQAQKLYLEGDANFRGFRQS